jgi:hypothetical protein
MQIAEAWVAVRAKTDTTSLRKTEGDVRSSFQRMAVSAAQIFTAAVFTREIGKMISAASNLGESVNAVNVTFGEAATGVLELGKDAATSLGLSNAEFNKLAVQFSNFAQTIAGPGGDVTAVLDDLTTRASDFASVMNIDVAEAAMLFQSGLAGETEPLRRYGIDLSAAAVEAHALETGINDGTHALTESEKVQARYSLLMEQTSKVQGDFANTSDSAANAGRILQAKYEDLRAEIGTNLLPALTGVVGILSEVVDIFAELPAPVQTAIVALAGMAAVAGPIGNLVGGVRGLTSIVGKLGPAFTKAAGPLAIFTLAVSAAVIAYQSFGAKEREIAQRATEVGEALGDQVTATIEAGTAAGNASVGLDALAASLAGSGEDGQKLTDALGTLGLTTKDAATTLIDLQGDPVAALTALAESAGLTGEQARQMAEAVNGTDDSLGLMTKGAKIAGEGGTALALAMEEVQDQAEKSDLDKMVGGFLATSAASSEANQKLLAQAEAQTGVKRTGDDLLRLYETYTALLADNTAKTDESTSALGEQATAEVDAAESTAAHTDKLDAQIERLEGQRTALEESVQALEDKIDAEFAAADSSFAVAEAEEDYTDKVAIATLALADAEATERDRTVAVRDATKSAAELAKAQVRLATDTASARGQELSHRAAIDITNRSLLTKARSTSGPVRASIIDYIAEINGIPPEKVSDILADTDEGTVRDAKRALDDVSKTRKAAVRADKDEASIATAEGALGHVARKRDSVIDVSSDAEAVGADIDYAARDRESRLDIYQRIVPIAVAQGGIFASRTRVDIGEDGLEVALPLTKPSRLRQLVGDPRVAGPIAAALADVRSTAGASTPGAGGGTRVATPGGVVINGDIVAADFREALAEMERRAWVAGAR